jgi:hypothetical protein
MPPLAVAKNDPVLTVGSHSICWASVEVDSLTMTESAGLTLLSVGHGDDRGLLQRQDVGEVPGEVLQERLLGRTGIAEDGR